MSRVGVAARRLGQVVRSRAERRGHGDAGFTVIELMVAMTVMAVMFTLLPRVIMTAADSTSYAQGVTAASAQATTAAQDLANQAASATEICLPTTLDTAGANATAASGFAVRVLSKSFGTTQWDQWTLNTTTHTLMEQRWPVSWTTGQAVPGWFPVASPIVNSTTAPFTLTTVTVGSPSKLSMDLQVQETYGHRAQTVELQSSVAAFNTPYNQNPTVACSTAATTQGWT